MPTLTQLKWQTLVKGLAAGVGLIDQVGQWCDSLFDVWSVEHDIDGNHTAPDISKGGAFVDWGGASYTLSQKYGWVSAVETSPASGADVRITLSTAFANTNFGVIATTHFDGNVWPTIIDESTIDFYLSASGDFNVHFKGV